MNLSQLLQTLMKAQSIEAQLQFWKIKPIRKVEIRNDLKILDFIRNAKTPEVSKLIKNRVMIFDDDST